MSTAFWLLVTARKNPEGHAIWVVIGALLGAAFVTRQTALAAVLFVAALCVFRPAVPRSRYFLSGVAFLIVVAADWTYLTAITGDPLYRLNVIFITVASIDSPRRLDWRAAGVLSTTRGI